MRVYDPALNRTHTTVWLLLLFAGAWAAVLVAIDFLTLAAGLIVVLAICGALAWRAWRMGVETSGGRGLALHGLVRTRTVRFDEIAGITIDETRSSRGQIFHTPALEVRDSSKGTRLIRLWWLGTVNEDEARQREASLQALLPGES